LNNLAYSHLKDPKNHPKVVPYYQASLLLFREINDERGLLYTTYDMGQAYLQLDDLPQALRCHKQALRMGHSLENPSLTLYALHGVACVVGRRGETALAIELCALLIEHPETQADSRAKAQTLVGQLMPQMPADLAQAAYQRGQHADLAQVVENILLE
jgi:tetratricopeptide (TPR) repeat protein